MLINKSILRFKKLYHEMYGIDLTEDEATKLASQIIELYRAVFGDPLISSDNSKNNERK